MGAIRQGFVRLDISISPTLHRRLKAVCKREDLKLIELTRDAIDDRVAFLEERHRKEEERRKAEREVASGPTKFTGFRKLTGSNLAPVQKPAPLGSAPVSSPAPAASGDAIEYAAHADKIYKAVLGGSAMEVRLCTMEAVAEIRRRHPLTAKDDVIIATLERLVLEKRATASTVTREDAAEIVIDTSPSKIKTYGSVTPLDSED